MNDDATDEQRIAGHAETVKLEVVAKAAAWDEVRGLLPRLIDELDGLRRDIREGRFGGRSHQSPSRMVHVPTTVACLVMIVISFFAYYAFVAEPRSRALNARITRIESTSTTARPGSVTTSDPPTTTTTVAKGSTGVTATTAPQRNGSSTNTTSATNSPGTTAAPSTSADTAKPATTTSTGVLCPRPPIC